MGHVYATILELSKNNDLFKNSQTLSSRTPEISRNFLWHGFRKTANVMRKNKRRQAKMEGAWLVIACYQL